MRRRVWVHKVHSYHKASQIGEDKSRSDSFRPEEREIYQDWCFLAPKFGGIVPKIVSCSAGYTHTRCHVIEACCVPPVVAGALVFSVICFSVRITSVLSESGHSTAHFCLKVCCFRFSWTKRRCHAFYLHPYSPWANCGVKEPVRNEALLGVTRRAGKSEDLTP